MSEQDQGDTLTLKEVELDYEADEGQISNYESAQIQIILGEYLFEASWGKKNFPRQESDIKRLIPPRRASMINCAPQVDPQGSCSLRWLIGDVPVPPPLSNWL